MDKIPLGHVGRSVVRQAKAYTKGYSDIQVKTRNATSSEPWGPSGSEMNMLAQATYNQQDFIEIMEVLDRRLNDKGKNWRHVFKSLVLVDYLLHSGSENCILYFQENMYVIKTLREFVYVDDDGKDQGANVRQKAKDITTLLMDDARIRAQRRNRSDMRDRMSGRNNRDDSDSEDEERRRAQFRRNKEAENRNFVKTAEDDELERALEESRRMAGMEAERSRKNRRADDDLEEALRLSREEEERRKRMLAGNGGSLFDPDAPENRGQAKSEWDSLIDMSDQQPPAQPQMPMITGFAQFNPYAQQQQQQQEYMRQQQQMLEMQRQMELQAQLAAQAQAEQDAYNAMLAQQAYMQQQQQYQAMLAAQQQQQQQQPLVPQHTSIGSNNPFAAFSGPSPSNVPEVPQTSAEHLHQPMPTSTAPKPKPILKQPKDDGKYAHLASVLGNRDDGVDTFGNTGALRYGHHSDRLRAQQTGSTNPFQRQQQQPTQTNEQPLFEL